MNAKFRLLFARMLCECQIPHFVWFSSSDEILVGVIHDWTRVVLECWAWFLYLAFVSRISCRCSLVVTMLPCVYRFPLNHCICFPFSKPVDSWFFDCRFYFLEFFNFSLRTKNSSWKEFDKCKIVVIFVYILVALIDSFVSFKWSPTFCINMYKLCLVDFSCI